MEDIDYLIRHEVENTYLDFKACQYDKNMHEALLKDIIAMANAIGSGPRYLIVGIKYWSDGKRKLVGVDGEFTDSAIYQQLVYENIEPLIHLQYFSHQIDGKTVGVFRISECNNKPYMMKKDYGNLRKGDAFVRRGDSQDRLIRADIDRMFEERLGTRDLEPLVEIGFDCDGLPTEISLPVMPSDIELPSAVARNRIRRALEKKKDEKEKREEPRNIGVIKSVGLASLIQPYRFGEVPYEERSIPDLEEALGRVKEDYLHEDAYTLYECHSSKVNLIVVNKAGTYIEDVLLKMTLPKEEGLDVADKVYSKPEKPDPLRLAIGIPDSALFSDYPDVVRTHTQIVVSTEVGDVKHHIPTQAFVEPIRLLLAPRLAGSTIEVTVTLHAKNLPVPLERQLMIHAMDRG